MVILSSIDIWTHAEYVQPNPQSDNLHNKVISTKWTCFLGPFHSNSIENNLGFNLTNNLKWPLLLSPLGDPFTEILLYSSLANYSYLRIYIPQ